MIKPEYQEFVDLKVPDFTHDMNGKFMQYDGNPKLKPNNCPLPFTADHVLELERCKNDIEYFAEKYFYIVNLDEGLIKIALRDYQKQILHNFQDHRHNIVLASRQCGKSTMYEIYLVHYMLFQEHKSAVILANKAQTAVSLMGRVREAYQNLPKWLQQGVVEWSKTAMVLENGCSITVSSTSSSAVRGMSVNCVVGNTKVTIKIGEDIFHTTIKKANKIEENINNLIKDQQNERYSMFYTVYEIKNKINEKVYIGFHSTKDLDDGYLGSGKLIKKAVEKYGPENFTKKIIKIFDNKKEAEEYERTLVNKEFVLRSDTYNLSLGGNVMILPGKNNGFFGRKHSQKTKNEIGTKNRGRKHNKDTKEKISKASKKSWENPKYREKLIEKRTGLKRSDETKKKISKSLNGRELSFEHKENLKKSKKEFFENMSKEERKKFKENTYTNERNKKISNSLKGIKRENNHNKNPEKIKKMVEKQSGCVWYYDPKTKKNHRIKKDEIPDSMLVKGMFKKCKF